MLKYSIVTLFVAFAVLCFGQRPLSSLKVTEIHYHPAEMDAIDGDNFEFIELKNVGDETINLRSTAIAKDIMVYATLTNDYYIKPGEFFIIARNSDYFYERYGFYPDLTYRSSDNKLKNSGGEILMVNSPERDTILYIKYDDGGEWPLGADGSGYSLVPKNPNPELLDYQNDPASWRESSVMDGTPRADDIIDESIPKIIVNEVASSNFSPEIDFIELYNPTNENVNIGGWYITDNRKIPEKWQIPEGTIIASNSYIVFYEHHMEDTVEAYSEYEYGSVFKFSSYGEEAYLFSAENGKFTGYVDGFSYESSPDFVPTGIVTKSDGSTSSLFLKTATPGGENADPWVGPVAISKINYSPVADPVSGLLKVEFLTLQNRTSDTIKLYNEEPIVRTWKITDAIDFEFPMGEVLYPNEEIYLIPDSLGSNVLDKSKLFKDYNIPTNRRVFQYEGGLKNSGETIELQQTQPAYLKKDSNYVKPEIVLDKVKYDNKDPWPLADSNGYMLMRISLDNYGNDPANWKAVPVGSTVQYISKGVNLISLCGNVKGELSEIFPDFYGQIEGVKNDDIYYNRINADYLNSLSSMEHSQPYFLVSDEDFQFVLDAEKITDQTIELKKGWNFIGISLQSFYTVEEIASKLDGSLIEIKDNFHSYKKGSSKNTLDVLEGGKAYYINVSKPISLLLD